MTQLADVDLNIPSQTQIFDLSEVIPSSAKEVLIYITLETGFDSRDTDIEVAVWTNDSELIGVQEVPVWPSVSAKSLVLQL